MPSRATLRLDQEGVDADGVVLLALPRPHATLPGQRASGASVGVRGRDPVAPLRVATRGEATRVRARSGRADGPPKTALPVSAGGIAALRCAWRVDRAWHVGSSSVVCHVMGAREAVQLAG